MTHTLNNLEVIEKEFQWAHKLCDHRWVKDYEPYNRLTIAKMVSEELDDLIKAGELSDAEIECMVTALWYEHECGMRDHETDEIVPFEAFEAEVEPDERPDDYDKYADYGWGYNLTSPT